MAARILSADASAELLSELRARVRAAQLLDRLPGRYAVRALLLSPLLVLLVYLAWIHPSSVVVILASAAAGLVSIQLGFIAHSLRVESLGRSYREPVRYRCADTRSAQTPAAKRRMDDSLARTSGAESVHTVRCLGCRVVVAGRGGRSWTALSIRS